MGSIKKIWEKNELMKWNKQNKTSYETFRSKPSIYQPGDRSSIPGRVIPKTLKMVLDTSLFNTQQYKVRIKGKVEQSRERSSAFPYTSM